MPVPKGMDPVLWYKIENSRKKEHKMAITGKPKTGGPMMKHPAGDENDSYLKPGQADVDDMGGKHGPKFQMPGQKQSKDKSMYKMQAIKARLGK